MIRRCPFALLLLAGGCFSPPDKADLDSATESTSTGADDGSSSGSSDPESTSSAGSSGNETTPDPSASTTDDPTGDPSTTDATDTEDTGDTETPEACADSPCPMGAACIADEQDGFTCDCTQGGSGADCDIVPECGNGVVEQGEDCDEDVSPTCSASCVSCDPPAPQALIEQELAACSPGAQSDCREGWAFMGNSSIQAFQVGSPGQLEAVQLYISNDDPSVEMTVHLVDGGTNPNFPSGASNQDLTNASLGVSAANGSQNAAWVEFDFSSQDLELDPTHYYYIWQRQVAPLPADSSDRFRWNLWASPEVPDPYATGRSFFCPANDGCSSQPQHWDFAFRVELTPAPPLCEG